MMNVTSVSHHVFLLSDSDEETESGGSSEEIKWIIVNIVTDYSLEI